MAGGDSARRERERQGAEAGGRKVWPLRRGGEDAFNAEGAEAGKRATPGHSARQRGTGIQPLEKTSGDSGGGLHCVM